MSKKGFVLFSVPLGSSFLYRHGLLDRFDTEVGHLRRYNESNFIKTMKIAHLIPYSAIYPLQTHHGRYQWILDLAENAVKVSVGKRKGEHSFTQDEINQLIVTYAHEFESVVRLKGGDPFVFGRGKEEEEFARFAKAFELQKA